MSFWEGETCEYCDGVIVEKSVTLHRQVHGQHILLEDVPAGVCTECGTRYYTANVLKTIEASIKGRQQASKEVLVPAYSLWPSPISPGYSAAWSRPP
ncbi:MAG: YgiT-type zinc finger protein [Planctomycetes bacterium]|nr:YgiT-type zinc finger protein [Planctomycetota bacterium]